MKALFFILCILLASTLSMPNFTLARQLAEKKVTPVVLTPGTVPCGRGTPYRKCLPENPKPPPPPKCHSIYKRGCN
ncbi:hypothetical protein PTKIN_Ptkin11bG0157500 [Pterospermum kingtungense]